MNRLELTEIIATRYLDLVSADGTTSPVVINIGKPRQFPDSTDFFTPYQVCGVGKEKVWYACGVDAVQSLQLVMGMIGAELDALKTSAGIELRWVGDDSGGLGFGD